MYKLLLENSLKESTNLINEGIDADFYQVMLGDILKDKIKSFIGHHIAEVQPMMQPSGYVFARQETQDTFKIIKKQIDVDTNKSIIKISQEAWEDLLNLSNLNKAGNEQTPELFINWVKSSAAHKETEKIINLIKENAVESVGIVLDDANDSKQNAETNLFHISKKVNDLVIKMNSPNFRTYDSFCILPQTGVGGILSLSFTYSRIDDSTDENRANDYFLGKINNTRYYLNPNPDDNNAYVGLKSHKEKGVNSLIYSPYCMNLTTAYNYQSGERTVGIFTRNAYTIHPLHSKTTPMLYKFTITEA
ncbi:hypothetical phage protein [Campylobacter phage CPt10]|uniref:Major capsid protein n=2 Tax=Firehammervirus CPt10 TaxID=722418 RepID=A0A410T7A7_9CAUD|nr:hypothetical protein APL46_gp180 [Campylobacter phage CPt10]QAU04888.1 hypothetical protein [Campylobacter phage CP20]CBJ94352.1 hypothetical phage protein [Campylobacter phage CPt10]